MAAKYGHLVKKLNFREGSGKTGKTGNADCYVNVNGSEMQGIKLNFSFGYYSHKGVWFPGSSGLHQHSYGEVFLFSGVDYNHPNAFGAEIEMQIGKGNRTYSIDSPSVVVIPPGLPHSLPVTRKVQKPFAFLHIGLDEENKYEKVESSGKAGAPGKMYSKLVKKMELKDMKRESGGNADYIAGYGGKMLEGLNTNFTWALHTGTGYWHEHDPHVHTYDEILVFVGLDPSRPEYLGAEIEIGMGKEGEKHVFDTSTVVVAPGGFIHCPLNTRKVEKPYGFSAICLNGEHVTTWLGK
ncbi:MAG: hypothetical protein JXA46_18765 [Dehalococcoidales bacterium]|nr:hypothetical protein [Dehalococcoidales bacterium]